MSGSSRDILNRQTLTFALFAIGVGIIVVGFSYFIFKEDSLPLQATRKTDLPVDKVDPQTILMTRIEGDNHILNQRLKYLEDMALENKKKEEAGESENIQLRKELARLKKELKEVAERPPTEMPPTQKTPVSSNEINDPLIIPAKSTDFKRNHYFMTEAVLKDTRDTLKHIDEVIPAGTTVKAILVSSVDAPCGVYSSTDPQPVKLRILDDGHLPKSVRARLKGGLIIASVYGDLSNERVYMRLERLTQIKTDGTFIETSITGFVTGEDGKYGLRGTVVDKSVKAVGNAALSGICSGISSSLQTAVRAKYYSVNETNVPFSPLACGTEGGVRGTCNAFDMLTDYFIKRAEQIRPVIEVTAGRRVDITFTQSAPLGDLYAKERLKEIRENSREG